MALVLRLYIQDWQTQTLPPWKGLHRKRNQEKGGKKMTLGIILFITGLLLIGSVLYSTFCGMPGRESRKEEEKDG